MKLSARKMISIAMQTMNGGHGSKRLLQNPPPRYEGWAVCHALKNPMLREAVEQILISKASENRGTYYFNSTHDYAVVVRIVNVITKELFSTYRDYLCIQYIIRHASSNRLPASGS